MNNQSIAYSPIQFTSKDHAREYCLSKECADHLSSLSGQCGTLWEMSETEPKDFVAGMGQPAETRSGFLASYIHNEIERLGQLRRYFQGQAARPGHKWVYSTHGLHSVHWEIDLVGANESHPVFVEYIEGQKLDKKKKREVFNFWLDCHKNPSLNNMFKLAYKFKLEELIPDNVKLLSMIRK